MGVLDKIIELGFQAQSPPFRLLDLPPEIRAQIYRICLSEDLGVLRINDDIKLYEAITLACRQTRHETIPIFLENRQYFEDWEDFIKWTAAGPAHLLAHIRCVFLRIYPCPELGDVNPFMSISQLRSFLLETDYLRYHNEAPRLQLQRQKNFILNLAITCPFLESLYLGPCLVPLKVVAGLKNLRELSWTGYSQSTPEEALCTLRALPHLDSLKICDGLCDDDLLENPDINLSFTDYVLRNLNPLKRLDILNCLPKNSPNILTRNMMKAMASHRDALTYLRLNSYRELDKEIMDELLHILCTFKLRQAYMCLSLPKGLKPPDIESHLSHTIQKCQVYFGKISYGKRVMHTTYIR